MRKKIDQKKIDRENPPIFTKEDFDPKNIKTRINTFIDLDILQELRAQADARGMKYPVLLNQILRELFIAKKSILSLAMEEKVLSIDQELDMIKKRLDKMENARQKKVAHRR